MPLDGNPQDYELGASTRLGRLLILKELMKDARARDQGKWCSCLWHNAIQDGRLLAAGLKPFETPMHDHDAGNRFFGVECERDIFGSTSMPHKRMILNRLIAEARGSRLKTKDGP